MNKPGLKVRNTKATLRGSARAKLRGIFAPPPEVRNPSGDWTPYYGKWFHQRPTSKDLSICWNVAACESMETQLQFLAVTGRFSKEDMDWFKEKGYIDADGDFYLSRRYIAVISGVRDQGNDHTEAWRLAKKWGQIPNHMFPYTNDEDFFEKKFLTQEMKDLGKQFLERVSIEDWELGKRWTKRNIEQLRAATFECPLQFGVPIPILSWQWNQEKIDWDGNHDVAHSIECRKVDQTGEYPYKVFDSYNPHLKELSDDYYIPLITRGVVNPRNQAKANPVSQETIGAKIYRAIWEYFVRLGKVFGIKPA